MLVKTFCFNTRPIPLNNTFANVPRKGRVKTKEYKKWIDDIGKEIKAQLVPFKQLVSASYGLDIQIGRNCSKADIDNLAKPICDTLVKLGITPDDKYLDKITIRRIAGHEWYVSIWDMSGHER